MNQNPSTQEQKSLHSSFAETTKKNTIFPNSSYEMMNFGSVVSGAGENLSLSAFSSLSALAPPFRVDRLNPKPNLQYSDYPYGSSDPFNDPWQYASPSASSHELVTNSVSTGTSSMPVSDHYQFSASMSISPSSTYWSTLGPSGKTSGSVFSYGGGVEPYYSTYVCPTFDQDIPLVNDDQPRYDVDPASGLRVSSQNDYVQSLYELKYEPEWVGSLGFDSEAQAKIDGSFSSENGTGGGSYSCNNQLNGGGRGIEYTGNTKEDNGVSREKFDWFPDKELHTTFTSVGHMEDKLCLEKNYSFLPYESNKILISASGSTYPVSREPNYQISCSTFEKYDKSYDSPFTGPTSAIRSSPAVVIRPPPAVHRVLGQNVISLKPACSDTAGSSFANFRNNNISERKDLGQKSNSEVLEDSYDANPFNISKQGNDQTFISSYPVKELSIPRHTDDAFDRNIKAGFGSQCHTINGSGGFASVPVVPSTEEPSDFIDHHNLAVDSPCWKGAHSSQFSSPDFEDGPFSHIKECLDQFRGFDHEKHENLDSIIDSMRISKSAGEAINNHENECARDALERSLDAIFPSREECSSKNVKLGTRVLSNDPNMPTRESSLPNSLKKGFDMKNSNSECFIGEHNFGSTLNDGSECGNVAVHASEKVLILPLSQEDAHTSWIPELDVSTLIKTMHNLSNMLLCHLSNDVCTLEEESTETLKNIINNLDSYKKSIQTSNASKLNNRSGDTTKKLQESHNVAAISGSLHMSNDAPDSHNQLGYLHMHEEKRKAIFSSKKDEKLPVCAFLMDDLGGTALDDDMTKAMKKVLDENFNFDEEMRPQSLLFKSLWLEAEAKLCSLSYRARFDRMKIEMEKAAHKPPKEYKDFVEMMPKVPISPDPRTASTHDHDSPTPKPQLLNSSFSSKTAGNADDIGNSVMTRFNILKSRDDCLNPNTDSIHKAHDHAVMKSSASKSSSGYADDIGNSVMARFNILKSREDNLNSINLEKELQPEITHNDSASLFITRFNILKSREENLKSINMEENRAEMGNVGLTDKQFVETFTGKSEDKILNVALRTHFLHQTGSSGEGKFGSYFDGYGYESLKELNDPIIPSLDERRVINQDCLGWGDSSCSDWEHVQKDDFAWKNL